VLAHEITHIAKHDVELMQLAGIVGQMTRVIAQVAIIIAIATWLLDAGHRPALYLPRD
jgi:Zn-dependent protease with chaperone function